MDALLTEIVTVTASEYCVVEKNIHYTVFRFSVIVVMCGIDEELCSGVETLCTRQS